MNPTVPGRLSIREIARRVRSASLSPVSLVEASLERIQRLDPQLRAWTYVDRSGALTAARALAAEARAGRVRGPLHGVPVAVKDIFDAAGMVTTSGAAGFAHRIPTRDAPSVARLREAGAVILGKTVTTEFAYADPSVTRNPWNLDHTPGGSSSGSAAAVAAGMVPLALGSQTIGSTLRPAAYCGVVGLKGTWAAISTEGVTPLAWSLDHVGILARSVEDAALVFSLMSGRRVSAPRGRGASSRAPRLAVPRRFIDSAGGAEVREHLRQVASAFARAGASVEDVTLPDSAAQIDATGRLILRAEAAAYHSRWFAEHAASFGPKIRGLVELGMTVTAVEYLQAHEMRYRFRRETSLLFDGCDALLLPAAPEPAPSLAEGTTGDPVFCAPWSFAGFPAIALPSGLSRRGLPLAIQLVGPMQGEGRLLDAARWCEARLEFTATPRL